MVARGPGGSPSGFGRRTGFLGQRRGLTAGDHVARVGPRRDAAIGVVAATEAAGVLDLTAGVDGPEERLVTAEPPVGEVVHGLALGVAGVERLQAIQRSAATAGDDVADPVPGGPRRISEGVEGQGARVEMVV